MARMKRYYEVPCGACGGYGMVSDYGYFGMDFYGAKECSCCGGRGSYVVYRNDRTAMWLGGPFTGSAPGLYDECKRPLPAKSAEAGLTITKVEDGLQRTSV